MISTSSDFADESVFATISEGTGSDTLLLNSGIGLPTMFQMAGSVLQIDFGLPSGGFSFIDVIDQTTNGIEFVQADLGDGSATTFTIQSGTSGTGGNDVLVGTSSSETITGSGGADILFGNGGDDNLDGGAGNDFLQGGFGNDIIAGGADTDTVDFSNAISTGVTVDLSEAGVQTLGGGLGEDTLSGIENVRGSALTDIISGDSGDNRIDGGDGDDMISGGAGNDTFVFGSFDGDGVVHFDDDSGTDTMILGSTGEETAAVDFWFFKNEDDLEIRYEFGGNPTGEEAFVTNQFLSTPIVEHFTFSDNPSVTHTAALSGTSGDDLIVSANSSVNATITGGDGDDALFGGIAHDLLQGGAGDDIFTVGFGDDVITDSGGVDFVEMFNNVGLDSAERVGNDLELFLTSEATTTIQDHFAGQAVEFVDEGFGQGFFHASTGTDGTSAEDLIAGGSGNDTLSGFEQHDHLYGGAGNDVLIGGGGHDFLQGDLGDDIFMFLDPSDGGAANDGDFGLTSGDLIGDFASGDDQIHLDGAAFGFTFTGALTLGSTFFVQADFDGTNAVGAPATDAYVVFDPNSSAIYVDPDQSVDGYTVVANVGESPVAADFQIV